MLRFYNTLTKTIEDFVPINPELVTVYCCGPTVYNFAHIGNLRTYTFADLLVRSLKYFGYNTKFVMNLTDVGHLVSDSDDGEDKMEKGARRENKTAWQIAELFTKAFLEDSRKLNLLEPDYRPKVTDHIKEQIEMVDVLFKKGYAYKIQDGIYFDTSKFSDYGKLTGQKLSELKAGSRVEVNPEKRHALDFALWKFSPPKVKRDMEWPSPWGVGFPGWHIECSVMSAKYLGTQIDLHLGGTDLIPIHHTNEIAQSESASGVKPFSKYWMHGQFVLVDGEKMSKSKNNFYLLSDITEKGFDPLALRYLFLTSHYRQFLNFTWQALKASSQSLTELKKQTLSEVDSVTRTTRDSLSSEKARQIDDYRMRFESALANDLNIPQALAVVWETVKSNIPSRDKYDLVMLFDSVLGLGLGKNDDNKIDSEIPSEIRDLIKKRDDLRSAKKFDEADKVRLQIDDMGYCLNDTPQGTTVNKKNF